MTTPSPDNTTPADPDLVAVVSVLAGQRRAQGLTQTDVADRARLSQTTISRVEAYDRASFPTIAGYARALGWRVTAVPAEDTRPEDAEL